MERRRWSNTASQQLDTTSPEDRLIAAFTQRSGLSTKNNNKEGRTRLRYLLTYGGIGILPKADWLKLIDSRLISFLYFLKLGKLDGTLDWSSMFQLLRDYASVLGIEAPSVQLTRAIFNNLSKPPHWHGGLGEAMALVRQRATLILNAPRLHEAWIALPLKPRLRVRLVDDSGRLISDYCSVVVVFDKASQRPVGCWTGTETTDIGLALYESIWHPGALYWPLRGTPDLIQVPQSLLTGRRSDLEHAAKWMLANVEILSNIEKSRLLNNMTYADDLLDRMSIDLPRYLEQKFGTRTMTVQQSLEAVLTWLFSEEKQMGAGNCFPAHRSSLIPTQCSDYGMLMPAYDSPAAGWLLPVVDHAISGRNKIVYRGITFTAADFKIEPGTRLNIRAFPYRYERMPTHVFAETESETIYCLKAHL